MTAPFDEGLSFWLCESAARLGFRSIMGAQIAAIERGASVVSTPSDLPSAIAGLDWEDRKHWPGARVRVYQRAWSRLAQNTRAILWAHYVGSIPTGRREEQAPLGTLTLIDPCRYYPKARIRRSVDLSRQRFPAGVESRLGQLAGVALLLAAAAGRLPRLLAACEAGDERTTRGAQRRAQRAAERAHREWTEARRKTAEEDDA